MDVPYILNFLTEVVYLLIVFGVFVFLSLWRGRQAIINITIGLYLALFFTIEFPYLQSPSDTSDSLPITTISVFAVIAVITTILCYRIMPDEFNEGRFESLGKKLLLAAGATILVMTFSFHILPVTELLTPGTPIQSLFAPETYFFWWLITPFVLLYFAV